MLPLQSLESRLRQVVAAKLPEADLSAVTVRPCPDPRFGDYQSTSLIALAKARKANPRELANEIVAKLDVSDSCEKVEIAGPGFLNFRLKSEAVSATLSEAIQGQHLFYQKAQTPRTIVVDFSSPNVAKPMHVGHIRSTILGDALARVYRLLGHRVITDNHIGDWGTQFGKLLVGWKSQLDATHLRNDPIGEMERLYRLINTASEQDPAVLDRARAELVSLQGGDATNLQIWREMIELSKIQFDNVYQRLGVTFDHTLGESFYNPHLKGVVKALFENGIAKESEGAIAVLFEDMPELKDHVAIIQKSDGGFNYATTDLATLEYRLKEWKPDKILYVTDGRQQLHFRQLFAIFRRWHPNAKVNLEHIWFGAILGEDGRPFKTRSGDTIKLTDLLNEAEERAFAVVTEKSPKLSEDERRGIARMVGLGAVKYADLLPNRQSDYIFSWDKMLALNGNTAPYLLYAYTRIRSIFRRANEESANPDAARALSNRPMNLGSIQELTLAKHLLNFGIVLEAVAEESRPNYLCNYLYDLAGKFTSFYEACPVLKAEPAQRDTRLALCELSGQVLKQGLNVLGLEAPERM